MSLATTESPADATGLASAPAQEEGETEESCLQQAKKQEVAEKKKTSVKADTAKDQFTPERTGFWNRLKERFVPRPKSELDLLLQRAESGLPEDQHELGLRYLYGNGVPKDFRAAEIWFRRALSAHIPQAQTCLGDMFRLSMGVDKSYIEARKFYQQAADQGWGEAQFRIGQLHEFAQGVKQDYKEAARWYKIAADQDVPGAQLFLGVLSFEGKGVPANAAEAYKWLTLAAKAGDPNAQACLDFVGPQLTREQIAEGERLLGEYRKMREAEEKNLLPKNHAPTP
ncbi:MAG: sel1 repeat family protein [Verrucomicrobia bacterium]|nr:sel1 repeat family protein [Verrucomicrobiota bacterium]